TEFNFRLANQHIDIEHCIGVVKGRFPILSECGVYLLNEDDIIRVCKIQCVCFAQHNMCI
ncbi:hypothetical protein PHYSODRAFT_435540, partial [Phytophthora sojae]